MQNTIMKTVAAVSLAGALAVAGTVTTATPSQARGGALAAGIGLGILGGALAANAYYPRPYYGYYGAPYPYYGPAYYGPSPYYGYGYGPRWHHRYWRHR